MKKSFKRGLAGILSAAMIVSLGTGFTPAPYAEAATENNEPDGSLEKPYSLLNGAVDGTVAIPEILKGTQNDKDATNVSFTGQNIHASTTLAIGDVKWKPLSLSKVNGKTLSSNQKVLWAQQSFGTSDFKADTPLSSRQWHPYSGSVSYSGNKITYENEKMDSTNGYAIRSEDNSNGTSGVGYGYDGYHLLKKYNNLYKNIGTAERSYMVGCNITCDGKATGTLSNAKLFPLSESEILNASNSVKPEERFKFMTSWANNKKTSNDYALTRTVSDKYKVRMLCNLGNYQGHENQIADLTINDVQQIVPAIILDKNGIVWQFTDSNNKDQAPSDTLKQWSSNCNDSNTHYCKMYNPFTPELNVETDSDWSKKICNVESGKTYSFNLKGLKTGKAKNALGKETGTKYVSANIYDKNGSLIYYGKLAEVTGYNMTVKVTIPTLICNENYTMAIFEEASFSNRGGSVGKPVFIGLVDKPTLHFNPRGGHWR